MKFIGYALALAVLLASSSIPQPPCLFSDGARVVLRSPLDDPRVLLWRERSRLADYLIGKWGAYTIEIGTSLLQPGTRAVVVSACPTDNRDVIGVRVISGPLVHSYGWVDIHDVLP